MKTRVDSTLSGLVRLRASTQGRPRQGGTNPGLYACHPFRVTRHCSKKNVRRFLVPKWSLRTRNCIHALTGAATESAMELPQQARSQMEFGNEGSQPTALRRRHFAVRFTRMLRQSRSFDFGSMESFVQTYLPLAFAQDDGVFLRSALPQARRNRKSFYED
jgi:hypothetical protein